MKDMRKALDDMRAKQDSDNLPPTTKITIDVKDERGKRYCHTFTYTVPNLGKQIEIGKLKTLYLPQGAAADVTATLLVEQIAYLTVTIDPDSLPQWWDPLNFYDSTPVGALYREALKYERRFHGKEELETEGSGSELDLSQEGSDVGSDTEENYAGMGDGAQPPAQRRKIISTSRR